MEASVGYWRPEPVKWKVRRHRGRPGDKRVGSEEASLQRLLRGPPCSSPPCCSVAEGWLASMGWLASGFPLEGHWCYVCRDCPGSVLCSTDMQCAIFMYFHTSKYSLVPHQLSLSTPASPFHSFLFWLQAILRANIF